MIESRRDGVVTIVCRFSVLIGSKNYKFIFPLTGGIETKRSDWNLGMK
jgi:hypothetical protein